MGVDSLHWPTAKPYQPTSSHFEPYTIGSTGAIKVDVDGDGIFTSAHDYLSHSQPRTGPDQLLASLNDFDQAFPVTWGNAGFIRVDLRARLQQL